MIVLRQVKEYFRRQDGNRVYDYLFTAAYYVSFASTRTQTYNHMHVPTYTHIHTHACTHTYIFIYIYVCVYIYICVCVCVCVCVVLSRSVGMEVGLKVTWVERLAKLFICVIALRKHLYLT